MESFKGTKTKEELVNHYKRLGYNDEQIKQMLKPLKLYGVNIGLQKYR